MPPLRTSEPGATGSQQARKEVILYSYWLPKLRKRVVDVDRQERCRASAERPAVLVGRQETLILESERLAHELCAEKLEQVGAEKVCAFYPMVASACDLDACAPRQSCQMREGQPMTKVVSLAPVEPKCVSGGKHLLRPDRMRIETSNPTEVLS